VAVKIKLMRMGKIRAPYYRIEVDSERAQYWLGVGAQPTEPVAAILKVTGDWQKFKGLPGAEGTLRTAEPRADKKAVFEAAAKDSAGAGGAKDGATTPKKRAAKKVAAEAAEGTPKADRPTADEAAADGDVRAAGSDAAQAPADATVTEEPKTEVAAADDSAAKATEGTAQGAPAIEETTSVERSGTDES
jgi:small subunit ribosomal protein S16